MLTQTAAAPVPGPYEKTVSAVRARDLALVCRPNNIPYARMMESLHWSGIHDFGGKALALHLFDYPQILDALARREGLGKEWTIGFLSARRVSIPPKKDDVPLIGSTKTPRLRWETVPGSLDIALKRVPGSGIETVPLWQADTRFLCVIKKRPPT
jgi:hypothetical protein